MQQTQALSLLVNHLVGQQDGLADLASSGFVALNARGSGKREKLQSSWPTARGTSTFLCSRLPSKGFTPPRQCLPASRRCRATADVSLPPRVRRLCWPEKGWTDYVVPGACGRLPDRWRHSRGEGAPGPSARCNGTELLGPGSLGPCVAFDAFGGPAALAVPQQGGGCKPTFPSVCAFLSDLLDNNCASILKGSGPHTSPPARKLGLFQSLGLDGARFGSCGRPGSHEAAPASLSKEAVQSEARHGPACQCFLPVCLASASCTAEL